MKAETQSPEDTKERQSCDALSTAGSAVLAGGEKKAAAMLRSVQLFSPVWQISPFTCASTSVLILPCLFSPLISKISGLRSALKTLTALVFPPRDCLANHTRQTHASFLGVFVHIVRMYFSGKTAFLNYLYHCYISQWGRQKRTLACKKMSQMGSNALLCSARRYLQLAYLLSCSVHTSAPNQRDGAS